MKILLTALALFAAPSWGEPLDRAVISVEDRVITENMIRREIRIDAALTSTKPDFSLANRRKTSEKIVNQFLIRKELDLSGFTPPPASQVRDKIKTLLDERIDKDTLIARLAQMQISEEDVESYARNQLAIFSYTEFRFGAGVQISDEEIREYYEKTWSPGFQALHEGAPAPPLSSVRETMRLILRIKRTNEAVDRWLAEARGSVSIIYIDPELKP